MPSHARVAWQRLVWQGAGVALGIAPLWLAGEAVGAVAFRVGFSGISQGWVEATGFSHEVTRESGSPLSPSDLVVTRRLDRCSPPLQGVLCDGQTLSSVRLEARETDPAFVRFFSIRLSDAMISSIQSGGDVLTNEPTERVSMSYAKIEWTYIQTDGAGLPGNAASTYWNLTTNGPADPDSDDDGMADSFEVAHGLLLLTGDGQGDQDHDGASNVEEFQAGTSASDSNSVFRVSGVSSAAAVGSTVRVSFASVAGRTYDLYATSAIGAAPAFAQTITATASTTTVDLNLPGSLVFVLVKVRTN